MEIPYEKLSDKEFDLISEVIYKDDFLGLEKTEYKVYNGNVMTSLIAHLKNNDEMNVVTPLKFEALKCDIIYK